MRYKEFKDGIYLSRLGMGTMRLPILDEDNAKIDYTKATKLIDDCMEQGVNYYDTAYIYHGGKSEEFLGKALAKYPRESFYVTDKYNFQAEPDYRKQFKEQPRIVSEVLHSRKYNEKLRQLVKGVMVESYLVEGRQDIGENHVYGKSITDPCLGWEETEKMLYMIAEKV